VCTTYGTSLKWDPKPQLQQLEPYLWVAMGLASGRLVLQSDATLVRSPHAPLSSDSFLAIIAGWLRQLHHDC